MSPSISRISIILYNIHKEKRPFYQFGLLRGESFAFPSIEVEEMQYDKEDILRLTGDYLKAELSNYHDVELTYQSDDYVDSTLYLYYEVSMNQFNSYTLTNSKIWFATIHELINTLHICHIPISDDSTNYLKKKIELFEDLSIPSIYYGGSHTKRIKFESLFGCSKVDGLYRFYDYFTAYDNAYIAGKEKGNSAGVLRYAVFSDDVENESTVESYDDFVPLSLHDIPILTRQHYELL